MCHHVRAALHVLLRYCRYDTSTERDEEANISWKCKTAATNDTMLFLLQ